MYWFLPKVEIMSPEALRGQDTLLNGHGPSRLEWEASHQIIPQSKSEAKSYLAEVPTAIKLIDLPRIGIDLMSAGQDVAEIVLKREFWEMRNIDGKKPLVVYSGGFGTNELMAGVPMHFLKGRGYDVTYYRYRAEKYPKREQAPSFLPKGANVEPLVYQIDDFVDFCIELADRHDQELALIGESKSGLLLKMALMFSRELRERTKFAITGGSPSPIVENINTAVLDRYMWWLDFFNEDDFMYTPLLTPYTVQRLDDIGLVSVENSEDRIMGRGLKSGIVFATPAAHTGMFRNFGVLSFVAGRIDETFHVQEGETKMELVIPRLAPWGFPFNPLLA